MEAEPGLFTENRVHALEMAFGSLLIGILALAAGVGILYGAKRVLPEFDLSDETLTALLLLSAMFGGLSITFGLFLVGLTLLDGSLHSPFFIG